MRVVVDGYSLGDASAYRGIGTYLRNVLPGLAGWPGFDLRILRPSGAPPVAGAHEQPITRRAPGRFAGREHDLRLPRDIRRGEPDVFFSPGVDPPRRVRVPWVQTIHGVLPLVSTDPAMSAERQRWLRYGPRLRRAAALIAVSHHCARLAVEHLGVNEHRVHVVPHGVGPEFCPGGPRHAGAAPYLLYVGEFGPWKGYDDAFDVIARLADNGLPHSLKVAGRIVPWTAPTIEALRTASPRPDRVDLLGYVPPSELPELYRGADAVVVTSRFESFGLPTLEALACGAPVVAYDNTATPEVLGDGGVLVADGDTEAMTEAVMDVIEDQGWRQTVVARALARAAEHSWERCVASHAQILEAAAR